MKCPRDCARVCFYCEADLSPSHEHDHYPTALRHGGEHTVPVCLNCHDLKDRIPLRQWPVEMAVKAFADAGPLGRILIAKAAHMVTDQQVAS